MPSGDPSGALYLVDAHSLIFQVFHAIRGMTSPTGMPTNALFGFIRDVLFLRSLRPEYLLVAFDRAEPTFRSDIYPAYKANREAMPDDLALQLPLIHQALEALSIPVVSAHRYEADDVMATLARAGEARGLEVFLCTSDKDHRQLITDRVRMYSLRKREPFGRRELLEDWGVTPEQVVDLQALVGDSVDNVPGVPGIGIKTAAKLLQDYGTLEGVLANVDKVSGAKRQENLRAAGPIVALSRPLVKLATDVPIAMDWEGWRVRPVDVERMVKLCREWGFQSLAGQVRTLGQAPAQGELFAAMDGEETFPFGANAPLTPPRPPLPQGERGGPASGGGVAQPAGAGPDARFTPRPHAGPPSPLVWEGAGGVGGAATYHRIDTPAALTKLLTQLRKQKRFAIDLETTSLSPLDARLVGVALAWQPGEAYYLPVRGPAGSALLDEAKLLDALRPLIESDRVAKVNQNIKYDLLVLRAHGLAPRNIAGDPMVADYLLHAGERSHGLDELARRYLNHQVIPITDLIGKKKPKQPQLSMDQVPTDKVTQYAGEDADIAWRLAGMLEAQLEAGTGELRKLYDELEVPLIEVLAELEYNGIRLDVPYLKKLGEEMGEALGRMEAEIYELAGHPFNIGSLPQLRKVLFDELKLPVQGRTGVTGAASTDQESLEKLAALDVPGARLPRQVLEHRQVSKLKGTYVDALPGMVNARTGRVHASFNQTVAATGRLSSSDPNLQNIPVRRDMGQQVRQAFLPEDGWRLLTADYSQIELRLLAHFCGDEALRRAFAEGRDVHAAVAAQIFNVPEDKVTTDQRRMAKTVNFGVLYGMSPGGLAQRLQIPRDDAAKFIDAYFGRYPKVEAYQAELLKEARRTGHVATILGRRRRFDPQALRERSSYQNRNAAEREAINMQIQGSAADLIKLAMLGTYRRLRAEKFQARMLLTVHDELVFEAPPDEVPRLGRLVQEEMTGPAAQRLGLTVPLGVDLAAGPNWLDVSPVAASFQLAR